MKRLFLAVILTLSAVLGAAAQVSGVPYYFTYQGKLNFNSVPANGVFEFIFKVYDGQGNLVGITTTNGGIEVTNGIFTTAVELPESVWTDANGGRFLEVGVKATAVDDFTMLQPITAIGLTPIAGKALKAEVATTALNADQIGGFTPSNFIQLNPSAPQAGGFSVQNGLVSGNLTAATVNAATQFNINGERILTSLGAGNLFAGRGAGSLAPSGNTNVGVGELALSSLTSGSQNTAVGGGAGFSILGGGRNTFVGNAAGLQTNNGGDNTFVGYQAGLANDVGSENVVIGSFGGQGLFTASRTTLVGSGANVASPGFPNASAFGYRAMVAAPDSLVLGSISGVNGADADTNVGIGTTTPLSRLDVRGSVFVGLGQAPAPLPGFVANSRALWLANDDGDTKNSVRIDGSVNNLYLVSRSDSGAATGGGIVLRTAPAGEGELDRVVVNPTGELRVNVLGANGTTPICRNALGELATCSAPLAAETLKNDEQDAMIQRQKLQIERQQAEIDALKALVCATNTTAAVCRAKE